MIPALRPVLALQAALLFAACVPPADHRPTPVDNPVVPEAARLSLEQRLPADTHLFVRLDPAKLLAEIEASARFIDPELAEQAVQETRRAWQSLVRMAANRGFAPRLAGVLFETPAYLVGRFLEGRAESPGASARDEGQMGLGLVLDCGPDLAADFLVHLRAELERGEEGSGRPGQPRWGQVEVDKGELIRIGDAEIYIGQVDGFLIMTVLDPGWLWQSVSQPAAASLADSERYGRFGMGDPSWFGWIDLRTAVTAADRQAERDYQDQLRRAEEVQGPEGRMRRQIAENAHQTYLQIQRLLSLNRLSALGARLSFEADAGRLRYGLAAGLAFDEPLSRAMDLLLDGGRPFRLPSGRTDSGLAVMWRFGLSGIYSEVLGQLPEDAQRQAQIMEASVQSATGYSILDLLKLLAGDLYLFLDVPELQKEAGDPRQSPQVRTLTLMGITDLQATERALVAIYEALAQLEGVGSWLGRREYMGRQVYLVGPASPQGERDPDQAMAVALLTDHLALGDWDQVTDRIREAQAGDSHGGHWVGLLERHQDASLLVAVSHQLWRRFEQMLSEEGDEPSVDELIAGLQALEITAQDDPAEQDLRDALVRLLQISRALSEREAGLAGRAVLVHGQRRGPLYELEMEATLERR